MLDCRIGLVGEAGFVAGSEVVGKGFLEDTSDAAFVAGVLLFLTERLPSLRGLECLIAGVLAFSGVASFVTGVLGFSGVLDFRGVFAIGGVFSLS